MFSFISSNWLCLHQIKIYVVYNIAYRKASFLSVLGWLKHPVMRTIYTDEWGNENSFHCSSHFTHLTTTRTIQRVLCDWDKCKFHRDRFWIGCRQIQNYDVVYSNGTCIHLAGHLTERVYWQTVMTIPCVSTTPRSNCTWVSRQTFQRWWESKAFFYLVDPLQ